MLADHRSDSQQPHAAVDDPNRARVQVRTRHQSSQLSAEKHHTFVYFYYSRQFVIRFDRLLLYC